MSSRRVAAQCSTAWLQTMAQGWPVRSRNRHVVSVVRRSLTNVGHRDPMDANLDPEQPDSALVVPAQKMPQRDVNQKVPSSKLVLRSQMNSLRAFSAFGLTAGQPEPSRIGQYLRNTALSDAAIAGLTRAGTPRRRPVGGCILSFSVRAARLVNCDPCRTRKADAV
jgi:hypothetical protein